MSAPYRGATTSMVTARYINDTQLIIAEVKTLRCRSHIFLIQLIPRRDVSAFRRVGKDWIFFMLLCSIPSTVYKHVKDRRPLNAKDLDSKPLSTSSCLSSKFPPDCLGGGTFEGKNPSPEGSEYEDSAIDFVWCSYSK
jgi:hypothetical protein